MLNRGATSQVLLSTTAREAALRVGTDYYIVSETMPRNTSLGHLRT